MVKGLNVVVLIPAFNEQETIAEAINSVPRKILGAESVKILVVDDGSTDATLEKAGKAKADRIVRLPSNRGLGVAFRKGIDEAIKMKADAVVNMDADLQFDANDIQKLLQPILKGEADMVTCTRFKDKSMQPQMPLVKKFGNKVFTSVVNFLTQQKFTDTQCGFRAYSREAMLRLNLFGKHTYTQEVFLSLVENDLRIVEVPCRVKGQRQGKSKVVPPTIGAISNILKEYKISLRGKYMVIVGAGRLVGKPLAAWMAQKNGKFSIIDKNTEDLSYCTKKADIVITGVGESNLIKGDMVRKGSAVIDLTKRPYKILR